MTLLLMLQEKVYFLPQTGIMLWCLWWWSPECKTPKVKPDPCSYINFLSCHRDVLSLRHTFRLCSNRDDLSVFILLQRDIITNFQYRGQASKAVPGCWHSFVFWVQKRALTHFEHGRAEAEFKSAYARG